MHNMYRNMPPSNYFWNSCKMIKFRDKDRFQKITPINGFDVNNPDNAMQNNYAWSMTEMGDYLYVGTGRSVPITMLNAMSKVYGLNIPIPSDLQPKNVDMRAEIWRCKKDGSNKWERVFKAPEGVFGFRFMTTYTTPYGEKALYASAYQALGESANLRIFKSTNGLNRKEITSNLLGNSSRAMIVHNNKLYMSAIDESGTYRDPLIYSSTDPERNGWELVTPPGGDPSKNPSGGVMCLISFNGHLYAATSGKEGFELWRTIESEPGMNRWKLIVDKGAGDAANRAPLTLSTFRDKLYVATISLTLDKSVSNSKTGLFSLFKPFDLISIDKCDSWEIVMGGEPIDPTTPTTGRRNKPISNLPSGAGNPFNLYAWQLREYDGYFYLGTFDWLVVFLSFIKDIIPSIIANPQIPILDYIIDLAPALINLILRLINSNYDYSRLYNGFDLYRSRDGIHWETLTLNGLGNSHNYGIRNLFVSENGHLYIGTANPYDGCEVWVNTK